MLRKKHQEKILLQKKNLLSQKMRWIDYILSFLFFCGLILNVFTITIFRKTVIDWEVPTGIWLGFGLMSMLCLRKYSAKYYHIRNILWELFITIGSFGGFFTYGFMATNYYFLDKNEIETIKTTIIKTGHFAEGQSGCGNAHAHVNIKGKEKQLVFPCGFEIVKYKFITVKLQRGFLGYDRIMEQIPENQ